MHLEQILRNLPLGVGTPYQKTGLKYFIRVRFRALILKTFFNYGEVLNGDFTQNPSFWRVSELLKWKISSTMVKC